MPRLLTFYSLLSFHKTGSSVKGFLLPPATSTTVGIIARDWCEWLSALAFVPLVPTWILILESKLNRVARKAFPNASFINGSSTSLSPMYILLLSGVTLPKCRVSLHD